MRDVAFDTETTGLKPFEGDVPFMVQWADAALPKGQHALLEPAGAWLGQPYKARENCVGRTLLRADRLIGHNLPFDVHHCLVGPGWDLLKVPRIGDTANLAQIVAPERRWQKETDADQGHAGAGYKLKNLSLDYVDPNAKDGEAELERLAAEHGFKLKAQPGQQGYRPAAYFELWKLEPEAVEFYAREDARLTLGLLHALEAKLTSGTRRIWELEQAISPIVIGAERRGVMVDREKVLPLKREYQAKADATRDELDRNLGDGWSDNNETLAEALLMNGVPLTEMTASGGELATNQKALGKFVDEHPIVQTLFDHRLASKFVATYLDHLDVDVVHPSILQIGTWTGRMANRTPNMQNVPIHAGTAVRELFIPRADCCFVALDFEQIELRALGYYLNSPALWDLIENEDFFAWVASQVYGGSIEQYYKGGARAALRQVCKNATYAIVYGAGGVKVGVMVGWPPDSTYGAGDWVVQRGYKQVGDPRCKRAETLIKQIKSILVGYGSIGYRGPGSGKGLLGRIGDKVEQTGAVDTLLGRHQWLGYDGAWKGLSGLVQGTAADLFKLAVVAASAAVEPLGAYPLLFIHDEILFETPVDEATRTLERAKAAMEGCYDLRPRLAAEGHIAYNNWAEAK